MIDWDAAANDARTHIGERKRTFPEQMALAVIDRLCLEGRVSQQELRTIAPSSDAVGTILGHVTTAVHGKGSVPTGGWYSKAGSDYIVHPQFAEAWIKRRRLRNAP